MLYILQKLSDIFFCILLAFIGYIIFSEFIGFFYIEKEISHSLIKSLCISAPIFLVYFFLVNKLSATKRNSIYLKFAFAENLILLVIFLIIFGGGI